MTATMSDAELLAKLEVEESRPSRNSVMRRFGVGAARAARLLGQLDESHPIRVPEGVIVEAIEGTAIEPVRERSAGPVEQSAPVRSRWLPLTVALIALPAAVAIWSGWVGLGGLTGFGPVHLLPGIADGFVINSAITLPIGVEAYAALALRVWLAGGYAARVSRFAKRSAIGSLVLGALGQVSYHLLAAAHVSAAPWWLTTLVSCMPVAVLGMASGLVHLTRTEADR